MSISETARLKILIGFGLSVAVLIAYWAVVENDFICFDDQLYVTENRRVQQGLSGESVAWAFTTSHASNWHPLTWLSLMLDREFFGMNPAGYHWTNVILHMSGGLLLFVFLSRMTAAPWPSGLVAALFLIHPLHVESVAWVAERKDVLSGLFWMMGLWCYVRYTERPALLRYLWVILAFAAGLLSKPMVVTFPFVLLLLDWWPLGRTGDGKVSWARLVLEKIPLFLLSAAVSVITFLVQKADHAILPLSALPLGDRLANVAVSYAAYLGKTFWPAGLSIFYRFYGSPPFGRWIFSLALLILITVTSVILSKRRPYLLVGWLWFLGTLVPVIGLVQVGSQAMADRYTYLPLVGIFIMAVWGARDLLDSCRTSKAIRMFIAGALVVVLAILTQIQVSYWKDTPTLFGHTLRSTERNFIAHHILADSLAKMGDISGAENHYREAIRIMPAYKQGYNGLGHLLMIQGKQDEAGSLLEKALRIDPVYVSAMKNLGDVRMRQRRIEDAIPLYRKAVLLSQGEEDYELLNNYGVALFYKGEREEAVQKISAALRLKPDYAEARANLQKISETGKSP